MNLPNIGFGTYRITDLSTMEFSIRSAYDTGYRLLDTADYYHNEDMIGQVLSADRTRKNWTIQTKVWPVDFPTDRLKRKIDEQLQKLQTDTIDIYLLHWPGKYKEDAWRVLEDYKEQGIFREIGVANFHRHHLEELAMKANIKPYLDQLETHVFLQQDELHDYLMQEGIYHQAWSPIAKGSEEITTDETLQKIAKQHGKSVFQIALRFLVQRNISIIPKATSKQHIQQNIAVEDFTLTPEEMQAIRVLNRNLHTSNNPDDENWIAKISAE